MSETRIFGKHDGIDLTECQDCHQQLVMLIEQASSSSPILRVYCENGCGGDIVRAVVEGGYTTCARLVAKGHREL